MAGETPFGSLGGQPIQSCRPTIIQFQKNQIDYSSIYRLANSYTCRIGHEFGTGWVLMLAKDLADIDSALPQDLVIGVGDKSVTIKKLAIVGSQRLFPAESQDSRGLHLVQLADVRWFLRRTTINKRYNLRKYCTSTGWIDGTLKNCCTSYQPWTFAEICEDIWGEFSSFGTFFNDFSTWATETNPAILQVGNIYGGDPAVIPENIRFEGVSALDALTSLCQQYGYFLRYDPTIGDLIILKTGYTPDPNPGADGWMENGFGGADTVVRDNRTGQLTSFPATPKNTPRTSSDGLTEDTETFIGVPYVPASVTVVFQNNGDGCSEIADIDSSSGRGWFYEVEKTAANIRSVTLTDSVFAYMDTVAEDTSVTLYSTVSARFTSSTAVIPTNATELSDEAERIATDYYRTIGIHANSRVVFDGIKEIIPGPNVCEVVWREWGDGLKTELAKMPVPVGLSKTQKLFSEGNIPSTTTTTVSPGTTTSTTTTIDPALRVCDGQCKWVWDASTGTWSASSSECSTTTTTSTTANPSSTTCNPNPKCTTSTSTTTSTTSTTTTTADPSSSTSSTSSTTSTSTTTAAPCKCMAPTFCGTDDGECWYGSCSQLYSTPISCPPSTTTGTSTSTTTQTTTTCDCNATTTTAEPTTTLDPSCTGCDTFFVGIRTIRVISGCDADLCGTCVEAENPQILGSGEITCSFVHTECTGVSGPGGVTTTQQGQQNSTYCGPQFPFTRCGYLCVGSIAAGVPYAWEYGGGNCYAYGCGCAPPARPCSVCGDSGLVPCGGNGPPPATTTASGGGGGDACAQQCNPTTTLTTTTTTTTATPCSACKFRWSGSSWGSAIVNNCSPCSCLTPAYSGTDACEVTWSGCGESTTTSSTTETTSTSTTSTTTSTTTTTTSTTTSTTTTSTTTTSTTTTTACPTVGTCNCQYQCNGTNWVYVNDACGLYGNCDAQNPGACTENGACTEVYCPGCPTTTTSTTTTAAPTTTTTTSVTAAPTTTTTDTTTTTTSTTTSTTTTATTTTTTSTTTTTCAPCADSNCIYVCSGGFWTLTGGSCIPLACRPPGCNCVDATFIPCSPEASVMDVACGVSPTTTAAP